MKVIHCADLHLDSKMDSNLDRDKAKRRKAELLKTFERMVDYAEENGVKCILIAGDMFDGKIISATARNAVVHTILSHAGISFYYLKGNHDSENFISSEDPIPDNLKLFDESWKTYDEGIVAITGTELSQTNSKSIYNTLVLDSRRINIVMLHGQQAGTAVKDKAEVIGLRELKNRNIDYLALGHVHAYSEDKLDARGIWCYPGCLEGRGFDECGEHGFVLLDIDESTGNISHSFVPFASRKLYSLEVDVSGLNSSAEMIGKCRSVLEAAGCESDSLVKLILKGTVDVECEKDAGYILECFEKDYFFAKLYDETVLKVDETDFSQDKSLKGEFVRTVMEDETLSEADRAAIIRYGLQAITGEDIQ